MLGACTNKGLAEGRVNCSFEDAVERHEFIEGLYRDNGYVRFDVFHAHPFLLTSRVRPTIS
jgi:hypothetical protein